MDCVPHRLFERLRIQLTETSRFLAPWKGVAYRVTTLDYPSPESILLGRGSFLYGGRWNAIGSFRAVYGSTADTVAVAVTSDGRLCKGSVAVCRPSTARSNRVQARGRT